MSDPSYFCGQCTESEQRTAVHNVWKQSASFWEQSAAFLCRQHCSTTGWKPRRCNYALITVLISISCLRLIPFPFFFWISFHLQCKDAYPKIILRLQAADLKQFPIFEISMVFFCLKSKPFSELSIAPYYNPCTASTGSIYYLNWQCLFKMPEFCQNLGFCGQGWQNLCMCGKGSGSAEPMPLCLGFCSNWLHLCLRNS